MLSRCRHDNRHAFRRDARGVSAIEFAIWAPLVCLMLFGGVEATRYAIATGRVTDVAGTMGQMLSVNTSGTVNYVDLQFYHDSAMVTFPQVLSDAKAHNIAWPDDMGITLSSFTFSPTPGCTSNCTYKPQVVWTAGTNKRSCTTPAKPAGNTSMPTADTLPADVFGPTSLLVVDVVYTFRPVIGALFFPAVKIARSFYVAPRYVSVVNYQTIGGDTGLTTVCSS